jgi:hypothetical protein
MPERDAREKLLDFLDRKAFEPVLKASPNNYSSEADKKTLQALQQTTRSTQRSYHEKYKTAEKVREMFRDDLNSAAAQKVHHQLRDLGLPTLNDIKDEFEKFADELDVGH